MEPVEESVEELRDILSGMDLFGKKKPAKGPKTSETRKALMRGLSLPEVIRENPDEDERVLSETCSTRFEATKPDRLHEPSTLVHYRKQSMQLYLRSC